MALLIPRYVGKSLFPPRLPANRKARRVFGSLLRRRKLRLMGQAGLFSPEFVDYCCITGRSYW